MPDVKISQLPIKTTNIGKFDLIEVSESIGFPPGANYQSKKANGFLLTETIFASAIIGSFYDASTQTTIANTPTAMLFGNMSLSNGVGLASPSAIDIFIDGIYNIQFSGQIFRTSGSSTQHIDIWLRIGGLDVPESNTRINVNDHSIYHVAAWNWFAQLTTGQTVEIMFAVSNATIELRSEVANLIIPHPETPSVIVTINRIG